jgi:hypothetical protein
MERPGHHRLALFLRMLERVRQTQRREEAYEGFVCTWMEFTLAKPVE